jgi:hypothetical protein
MWAFFDGQIDVKQSVRIEPVAVQGKPWLALAAGVCERGAIDPALALEHNAKIAVGCLAFVGPFCVLRHTMPLDSLTDPDLDRALEFVPHEAARVRRFVLGSSTHVFDQFAE